MLAGYPFARAARPSRIPAESLTEICVGWAPPAVRTREGEFLFIEAPHAAQLAAFGERNGVPFVRREDVWSLILEPFLDTEFGADARERTLARLGACGVPRDEVASIRERVEWRMLALTAVTWEWVYYGLYDVLTVMRSTDFYAYAMRIADRGPVRPSTSAELLRLFPRAQ